jgi:hypothetical protein
VSPFVEDRGYTYGQRGAIGPPPFGNALEPKANEPGLQLLSPDLFQTTQTGDDEGASPFEKKVRYCKLLIKEMVTAAGGAPIWTPAPTYDKQDHDLAFAMFILPKRPNDVTDLRSWLPPSCRKTTIVKLAIQNLLATKEISQRKWGRGVVLYVGEAPKFRGE